MGGGSSVLPSRPLARIRKALVIRAFNVRRNKAVALTLEDQFQYYATRHYTHSASTSSRLVISKEGIKQCLGMDHGTSTALAWVDDLFAIITAQCPSELVKDHQQADAIDFYAFISFLETGAFGPSVNMRSSSSSDSLLRKSSTMPCPPPERNDDHTSTGARSGPMKSPHSSSSTRIGELPARMYLDRCGLGLR
jgi:hypothetical protein